MKKVTTLVIAMMALSVSAAMAQINFYVGDCGQGSTTNTASNTCTSSTGTAFQGYCSMVMPAVTRTGFVGSVGVIDVETTDVGTINDWWRGDACRNNGFLVSADAGMGGSCPTLWDNVPGAGANFTALYGAPGAPANRIRFLLGQVLASTDAYDLTGDATTEISVFRLSVQRARTTGSPTCAGCLTPACLVLQEINLQTLTDTPATFLRLTAPVANNYISYNAFASPACPDQVPVRNRTWGAVKALYR